MADSAQEVCLNTEPEERMIMHTPEPKTLRRKGRTCSDPILPIRLTAKTRPGGGGVNIALASNDPQWMACMCPMVVPLPAVSVPWHSGAHAASIGPGGGGYSPRGETRSTAVRAAGAGGR